MLKLCRVTKVKVLFLVLVFVFNFDLFKFAAAILEKGLFLWFEERFRKAPFSSRISVDGRPKPRNEAASSNSLGVMRTLPKARIGKKRALPRDAGLESFIDNNSATRIKWNTNFLQQTNEFPFIACILYNVCCQPHS